MNAMIMLSYIVMYPCFSKRRFDQINCKNRQQNNQIKFSISQLSQISYVSVRKSINYFSQNFLKNHC